MQRISKCVHISLMSFCMICGSNPAIAIDSTQDSESLGHRLNIRFNWDAVYYMYTYMYMNSCMFHIPDVNKLSIWTKWVFLWPEERRISFIELCRWLTPVASTCPHRDSMRTIRSHKEYVCLPTCLPVCGFMFESWPVSSRHSTTRSGNSLSWLSFVG